MDDAQLPPVGRSPQRIGPPLASDLLARRNAPLCIDARAVRFAGALALQVLIAAQKQWLEDGKTFKVTVPSPAFSAAADGLGVGATEAGARHAIIITVVDGQTVGLLADVVSDILAVPEGVIHPVQRYPAGA